MLGDGLDIQDLLFGFAFLLVSIGLSLKHSLPLEILRTVHISSKSRADSPSNTFHPVGCATASLSLLASIEVVYRFANNYGLSCSHCGLDPPQADAVQGAAPRVFESIGNSKEVFPLPYLAFIAPDASPLKPEGR